MVVDLNRYRTDHVLQWSHVSGGCVTSTVHCLPITTHGSKNSFRRFLTVHCGGKVVLTCPVHTFMSQYPPVILSILNLKVKTPPILLFKPTRSYQKPWVKIFHRFLVEIFSTKFFCFTRNQDRSTLSLKSKIRSIIWRPKFRLTPIFVSSNTLTHRCTDVDVGPPSRPRVSLRSSKVFIDLVTVEVVSLVYRERQRWNFLL